MNEPQRQPSLLLDFVIVIVAVSFLVAIVALGFEAGHPANRGALSVLAGFYVLYLGGLFALSYFFPRRCFILNLLGYICEARSRPAGRAMAWFYFALSTAIGSYLLVIGLGVL